MGEQMSEQHAIICPMQRGHRILLFRDVFGKKSARTVLPWCVAAQASIAQQRAPTIAFHHKSGRGLDDPDPSLIPDIDKHVALLDHFDGQVQMTMQQAIAVAIANNPNIRIHILRSPKMTSPPCGSVAHTR
jgi:hypothetical protein